MKITNQNPLISIVIPTVNQVQLVTDCLDSLLKTEMHAYFSCEIIIVDDGSSSSLQAELRQVLANYPVRLLTRADNRGFAATVNQGVAASSGKFICLLNNDVTLIQSNWLSLMLQEIQRPKVGLVGLRLLYPNHQIQHGGIIYVPETGGFDHEYRYLSENTPEAMRVREVLGVTGAIMLIERTLWNQLGGMDQRFFVGMEDVDFSLRTWENGWRVVYTGAAYAIHPEGTTRGPDPHWHAKGLESCHQFAIKWQSKLRRLRIGRAHGISLSEAQAREWQRIVGRNWHQSFYTQGSGSSVQSRNSGKTVFRSRL